MSGRLVRAALAGALLIGAMGCHRGSASREASSGKANIAAPAVDAEMAAKLAAAKANFEKLSPAEKMKLQAAFAKASNTLPLSLKQAGNLSVRRWGQPQSTLSSVAPPGQPTVIAAWASWCAPCKLEARELARLRKQYRPDQLNIVYLDIGDPKVEATKGPEFLRQTGAEALGLSMFDSNDFLKLTRVDQLSVPRVLLYDRGGKPTEVIAGGSEDGNDTRIARAITKLVGA